MNALRSLRHLAGLTGLFLALISSPTPTLAAAPARPPSYRDPATVLNGCHISALAFLDQFGREFPHERGEAIRIMRRTTDGVPFRHTVALVSWQGNWWCRDNLLGVVALKRSVAAHPDVALLGSVAEEALDEAATRNRRGASLRPAPSVENPEQLSFAARRREVEAAAALLPLPSTIYLVRSGRQEFPVLFFRPSSRQIGVYEPTVGSCIAETAAGDDRAVVALVAAKLGYQVSEVRPVSSARAPAADRMAAR